MIWINIPDLLLKIPWFGEVGEVLRCFDHCPIPRVTSQMYTGEETILIWRCPKMEVAQIIQIQTILVLKILKPIVLGMPHLKKELCVLKLPQQFGFLG